MDPESSLQLRVKDDVTGAVSVEAKSLTMLTVLLLISHRTFSGMWTLEKRCRTVERATCLMASNFIVSGSEQLSIKSSLDVYSVRMLLACSVHSFYI